MRWLRSTDHSTTIQDLRRRIVQLRRHIDVHEQQIARLEKQVSQVDTAPDPWSDRLDAYLGHVLPMIVLGVAAGAISVVSFFTVETRWIQVLLLGVLAVGCLALVTVHWLQRRRAGNDVVTTSAEQGVALALYALGVGCLVISTILIAMN